MTTIKFRGITATPAQIAQRVKDLLVDVRAGTLIVTTLISTLEEASNAIFVLDPDRIPAPTAASTTTKDAMKWCVLCNTGNVHGPYVSKGPNEFAHRLCYEYDRSVRADGMQLSDSSRVILAAHARLDDTVTELWLKTKGKPDASAAVEVLRATLNTFSVEAINQSAVLIAARVWVRDYDAKVRDSVEAQQARAK